jgi:hypothetical protein
LLHYRIIYTVLLEKVVYVVTDFLVVFDDSLFGLSAATSLAEPLLQDLLEKFILALRF